MRVLIVPDKFKGTLDAVGVARAISRGWRRARPSDTLTLLPMSDGGDGFGSVVGSLLGARPRTATTVDAAGRARRARWWWAPASRTALIEAAQSNGLALLPPGRFHPFELDTRGVAVLVERAVQAGARTCILGIGGSATNDGGFGLARAVGYRFVDRAGTEIVRWTDLERLHAIEAPAKLLGGGRCRFVVATDVENPLLGARGASRVYGPQKGLRPEDMSHAEACLGRLACVVRARNGFDSRQPGCGAAGGLGYGLQAFLGAAWKLGFDVFAELARLDRALQRADFVVSGEGSFDRQSLMGKGVGQVLALARKRAKPTAIVAGRIADLPRRLPPPLIAARGLVELTDEASARRSPARWLERLAREVAAAVDA